jgi:hypothetical protein
MMSSPDSRFAFNRPVTDDQRFNVAGDVIDKSKEFSAVQRTNRLDNAGGFRPGVPSAPIVPLKPVSADKG